MKSYKLALNTIQANQLVIDFVDEPPYMQYCILSWLYILMLNFQFSSNTIQTFY